MRVRTVGGKSVLFKLFHPFPSQFTRVRSVEHWQDWLSHTSSAKVDAMIQNAWKKTSFSTITRMKNNSHENDHWLKSVHDLKGEIKQFLHSVSYLQRNTSSVNDICQNFDSEVLIIGRIVDVYLLN